MDSILIILKKKNGPRASSAPILGLFSITFVYSRSQVSVYRTIGPLVFNFYGLKYFVHVTVI